ncbi:MAG: amidohydrolase family protein, partial [Pseudoxanthomonas sp.]|nr:amidohydrolase family protein [Pseudoxanthomonas sp.]
MPLPRPLLTVLLAAAVLPVSSAVAATPAADADLHCGRLFDARSGKLLGPHTVQVQAGRIVAVSPGLPSTTGSGAIDLRSHTCLPGWTDLHVHLGSQSSPQSYSEGFRLDPVDFA